MDSKIKGSDFLDSLLLRFRITLRDLADCDSAHHGEIEDMERIFDLKSAEDVRRLLVVPRLLDPLAADKIIAYLRDEEKEKAVMDTEEGDFEEYKLLLAAAFVFNPSFFAAAWNWCAFVRQELQKQKQSPFEIVVFGKQVFRSDQEPVIEYRAASGAEPVWREFGKYKAPVGLIRFLCLDTGSFRYLKFNFTPETPIYVPYRIEVEFVTGDNTAHTLIAINESGGSGNIASDSGENVDYTLGLNLEKIWIGPLEERHER
jgi:hypothetical protein